MRTGTAAAGAGATSMTWPDTYAERGEYDLSSLEVLQVGGAKFSTAAAAWIGGASRGRAMLRVVIGGALALAATFAIGALLGTTVG